MRVAIGSEDLPCVQLLKASARGCKTDRTMMFFDVWVALYLWRLEGVYRSVYPLCRRGRWIDLCRLRLLFIDWRPLSYQLAAVATKVAFSVAKVFDPRVVPRTAPLASARLPKSKLPNSIFGRLGSMRDWALLRLHRSTLSLGRSGLISRRIPLPTPKSSTHAVVCLLNVCVGRRPQ